MPPLNAFKDSFQHALAWHSPSRPDGLRTSADVFMARLREQAALEQTRHLNFLQLHFSLEDVLPEPGAVVPETARLLADLCALLQDRQSVISGQSKPGARVSQKAVSARSLIKLLDEHASNSLQHALQALDKLASLHDVWYLHADLEYGESITFSELTDAQVSSPAYLRWATGVAGKLPRKSQAALAGLLADDADLQWERDHGTAWRDVLDGLYDHQRQHSTVLCEGEGHSDSQEGFPQPIQDVMSRGQEGEHDFADSQGQPSMKNVVNAMKARPFIADDYGKRKKLDSEGLPWTAFAPWARNQARYDVPAWPFLRPLSKGGMPSPQSLRDEARSRHLLGSLLRMPREHSIDEMPADGVGASHAERQPYLACVQWTRVADAGLVLRVAAAAMALLADMVPHERRAGVRCHVCWRHLSSSDRLYCRVHKWNQSVRSDADRLKAWAHRRKMAWDELVVKVKLRPHLDIEVGKVTALWNEAGERFGGDSASRMKAAPEAMKQRLHDLVQALTPFAGGDVAVRIQSFLQGYEPRKAAELHPMTFFGAYFMQSRSQTPDEGGKQDTFHPLNVAKHGDQTRPDEDWRYTASDLICDLLHQHVWWKIGGPATDADIPKLCARAKLAAAAELEKPSTSRKTRDQNWIPSPPHKARKIDPKRAYEMKVVERKTYADIARAFGVTPAAVSLFFKTRTR